MTAEIITPEKRRKMARDRASVGVGILLVRPGDGDSSPRRSTSTEDLRSRIAEGYRPIGPVGWERLRQAGFLPEGESYLGGRRGEDEE